MRRLSIRDSNMPSTLTPIPTPSRSSGWPILMASINSPVKMWPPSTRYLIRVEIPSQFKFGIWLLTLWRRKKIGSTSRFHRVSTFSRKASPKKHHVLGITTLLRKSNRQREPPEIMCGRSRSSELAKATIYPSSRSMKSITHKDTSILPWRS